MSQVFSKQHLPVKQILGNYPHFIDEVAEIQCRQLSEPARQWYTLDLNSFLPLRHGAILSLSPGIRVNRALSSQTTNFLLKLLISRLMKTTWTIFSISIYCSYHSSRLDLHITSKILFICASENLKCHWYLPIKLFEQPIVYIISCLNFVVLDYLIINSLIQACHSL